MSEILTVESPDTPYYARPHGGDHYTWAGQKYRRVTGILGEAPGQFLMTWAAKQASLRCAAHLYDAGLVNIPVGDEELYEFCAGHTPRDITPEQAYVEILAWSKNLRESERYRDFKSRVGSIVHHAFYRHALGDRIPQKDLVEYLSSFVTELGLFRDPARPEFVPTKSMIETLAVAAESYTLSVFEWIEKAQPEFEEIGLEAVIVHYGTEEEDYLDAYAGATDAKFTLEKTKYEKHFDWIWEGNKIKPRADLKSSNTLPKSVILQVTAYDHGDIIGIVETGEEFELEPSDIIGCLHAGPHESRSVVTDEFGSLESRAKQVGCKFHTWPSTDRDWQAWLGLCKYANWVHDIPRSQQQRPKSAPKAPKLPPTVARKAPF